MTSIAKIFTTQPKSTSHRTKKQQQRQQQARFGLSANTDTRAGFYTWFCAGDTEAEGGDNGLREGIY